MRFDGFVPHFSMVAGSVAATCLVIALIATSVVVARKVEATICQTSVGYFDAVKLG